MSMVINTNISAINAQRNLNKTQSALQTAMQRLSSGLRINSAKDDAAGIGIASRMTAQIRGLSQAIRNANNAISLAQTMEGALNEIHNMLQRMRELAVQAADDSNTNDDRTSLNAEFTHLKSEIDRIANSTKFNNQPILNGGFGSRLGTVDDNLTPANGIAKIESVGARPSVLNGERYWLTVTENNGSYEFTLAYGVAADDYIYSQTIANVPAPVDFNTTELHFSALGIKVTITSAIEDGVQNLTDDNGFDVVADDGTFQIGNENDEYNQITISAINATIEGLGDNLSTASIATRTDAQFAIDYVQEALNRLISYKGDLGAIQNRLEYTISNLNNIVENISAARSRIMDADFAVETANLTRATILQQAAISVLAQANLQPQNVLALLQR